MDKMEVLLDTSFILSCVRKRIDFITKLEEKGFRIVLPREVLEELKDLKRKGKQSLNDREAINLALEIFEKRKIKKTGLGGNSVDEGLIKKGKEGAYIATLDSGIKREVPNKIIIFNSKNSIGVERD